VQASSQIPNWSAIILAGGNSSRMGQEKGLVPFLGKPMIAHGLEAVAPLVHEILIVANHTGFEQFGFEVIADDIVGKGPLSGLCTGLRHAPTEWNLVLSCDVPLVPTQLLRWIMEHCGAENAVVLAAGYDLHPLIGAYRRCCLPTLERLLLEGNLRMRGALEVLNAKVLHPDEVLPDFKPNWLRNFNSPEDIAAYEKQ
jgi:molybdenum cofactor guanylyltransferase